jgi:hypothetical protein
MKTRFERCPPGLHDYAAFADAKTGQDGSLWPDRPESVSCVMRANHRRMACPIGDP